MNRKILLRGLAAVEALVLTAALVVGASASPSMLTGTWYSVDNDGSNQTLHIGGGPGHTHYVTYFDDGASICGLDENGYFLYRATARGFLTGSEETHTLSGALDVNCLASPPYVVVEGYFFGFTHDLATDTLTDGTGVVWSR